MGRGDGSGLTIVKLGGSLIGTAELRAWLASVARMSGPRLVVPGGGPFADTVRRSQAELGFDDLSAHRMAILAMQQYGLVLGALEPRLQLVESDAELSTLIAQASAGIWLPWAMIGRDESIRPSWEVTSDSVALILATRLEARRLLLVKAASVPCGEQNAEGLADAGLIDAAFPALLAAFRGEVRVVQANDLPRLGPGCRVRSPLPAAGSRPM